MEKLKFNPSNKKYYSDDFIKGFECGVERQFNADMADKTDGDLISKSVLDQIKWERDLAISQLQDLGYELGEKPRAEKTAELRIVGNTTMHYECSLCGGAVDKWDKFCKNCGRFMQKGVEE